MILKDFWRLFKPYWTSEEKWRSGLLLLAIIGATVAQVRLMVIFNGWQKAFYDALQAFNMHWILIALGEFVVILLLAIIIFTYISYLGGYLVNAWRRWLTHQYVARWLEGNTAYAMQVLNKNMDNPDQRISEDLSEFPSLTLNLFSGLFSSILTLISFGVILWNLSGHFSFALDKHIVTIPGYMLWATLLYALVGTWITHLIGRRLTPLNYLQEKFNANFRFGLVKVRESTEQISLYQGQAHEARRLEDLFHPVFTNFLTIIRVQKYLGFFTNGYNLLTQVIGILIALPRYIHERLAIGSLLQVNNAFGQVTGALSFIVFSYSTIANWQAVIRRLTEFNRLMAESQREITEAAIKITRHDKPELRTENLQLLLPNHQFLAKPLSFLIRQGEWVLITGHSGSGKSTLLRTLAGIWPYGHGDIQFPCEGKKLFLPQKPYFPLGTLAQALQYPSAEAYAKEKLLQALQHCGLEKLAPYLNETRHWSVELSLGEQQLVAFARIFLYQPQWIFLDEATSALDEKRELIMYQRLQQHFPTAAVISVGHRSSLRQFHAHEIVVEER